jgi:Brp/Blh family beta-carotene 15,15'-monooxygenase
VLVFGLPHGALDPLVARRAGLTPGLAGALGFHLAYGAIALAVLWTWMIAPVAALIGFLAYSAYHFGGDWTRPAGARLALGAAVLSLPSVIHPAEVGSIYALLSGEAAAQIAEIQHRFAPVWLTVITACIALNRADRGRSGAELAGLTALAFLTPPLIFFMIYFCALHSPRHFLQVWRVGDDRRRSARVAVIYTALAAALALAAAWIVADGGVDPAAISLQIVFIGLAALTAPHLVVSSLSERRTRPRSRDCATFS